MFSTSEIPKADDKMNQPTKKGQLIVVADAASPQAQSVIETLLRHNFESKQLLRNKIAARVLAAQQAAQKAASEAARAQATEGAQAPATTTTPTEGTSKDGDNEKNQIESPSTADKAEKAKDTVTADDKEGDGKTTASDPADGKTTSDTGDGKTDGETKDTEPRQTSAEAQDSDPPKADAETEHPAPAKPEPPTTPVKGGAKSAGVEGKASDDKDDKDSTGKTDAAPVAAGLVRTGSDEIVKTPPKKTTASPSADLSPSAIGKATAAAIASESCAVADDSPPSTPSQKQKEQASDEEAALAAFPLHTQSSAVRFTENLPPSLSSPLRLQLTTNVPNDSTTSTVLVDSEGIVRPVGIQPITNNIFESIKGSRSQSFSRFKDDPPENSKTVRSNSAPNATTTSSSLGKDEPSKDKVSPGTSTATSNSNSNTTSTTSTAANSNNSSTDSTFNIPPPKSKDGSDSAQPVDEGKKEQLAQEARMRAAVKFQGSVEDTVKEEYVQPWTVHAVFNHETPDEVMHKFQQKMLDMIKASFNDEEATLPVVKVDFGNESAVDKVLKGANGVFVALFDKRGLPWNDMATPGRLWVDAAHRAGADHFIACCIADLECQSQLPLPKSIADGRAIREYLKFQSADGEQIVEISTPLACLDPATPSTPISATLPLIQDEKVASKDEKATAEGEKAATKDEAATTKDEKAASKDEMATIKADKADTKDQKPATEVKKAGTKDDKATTKDAKAATKDDKEAAAVAAVLAKSTYFKHCTTLSIAVPFEAFLSEKVFHFAKVQKHEDEDPLFLLQTHIPVTEWFPFSSLRDVGPFALQSFLAPDARESHHLSLVSDFTCLRQATHQAAQMVYHSQYKVQCPDPREFTVGMFLGDDKVRDWYVKEGLDEVYHLLAWWITSKASDAFWRSGAAFPGRNRLSAWRHYIYAEVDTVLPGWKDPEGQWHSKQSTSTNSYQFNQEPSMFSSRYASAPTKRYLGRGGEASGGGKKASRKVETPREETDQLDFS